MLLSGPGAPLQGSEREHRGGERIAQLVGEHAELLVALARDTFLALPRVFGDCTGNGFVQAAVEDPKVLGRDRRFAFEGQLGHDLAHVAVTMHDLRDAEAHAQQVAAMLRGALVHVLCGGALERLAQLGEEEGDASLDLGVYRAGLGALGRLGAGAGDDLIAMLGDEVV